MQIISIILAFIFVAYSNGYVYHATKPYYHQKENILNILRPNTEPILKYNYPIMDLARKPSIKPLLRSLIIAKVIKAIKAKQAYHFDDQDYDY